MGAGGLNSHGLHVRAHNEIIFPFCIPSLRRLWPILNREILTVATATPRISLNRIDQIWRKSGRKSEKIISLRALKSYWDGKEIVFTFYPKPYHTGGVPGYVYGGLLASIIDCHATGTAVAAAYRAEGRAMGTEPALRFVTKTLHVDYLRPTPVDGPLELQGYTEGIEGREVVVAVTVSAQGKVRARGKVVAVRVRIT